MCIGYHFTWNMFQSVIYGMPVSGINIKGIITTSFPSDTFLNGGVFGIEGGILTTLVTILSLIVVRYWYRNSNYDFIEVQKKKVAFICVHNSCRSQIAEALGKHLASDVFESYSAGSETKPQINQDAVHLMKQLYGIDMEATQYSKTFDKVPEPDIAISMGCDVACPCIGRGFDDNWGLEDPTSKSDECFIEIIKKIEGNIRDLKRNGMI